MFKNHSACPGAGDPESTEDVGTAPFDFSWNADRGVLGTLPADIIEADVLHS